VRAHRRAKQWDADFTAATSEVRWFAHEIIPQLAAAPSAAQMQGGWRVASPRVAAVEDKLTAMAAAANNDTRRARAGTVRDAVRAARANLDALDPSAERGVMADQLQVTGVELQRALDSVQVAPGAAGPA
jgi:hypothetical protein